MSSGGGATNLFGLNAAINQAEFGYTIEPPDQGVCANSQYVLELVNIGSVQAFSASNLSPVANGYANLDNLMGLTTLPSPVGPSTGWSSAGDVSCVFDSGNGGHWFITEFVSTSPETPVTPAGAPGPFQGCFVAVPDTCREGIAVSQSSNPLGAYNVYFLDPNFVNHDPGASTQTLLNDFTKTGTTQDAFLMFYDEFNLIAGGLGGASGSNGAQEFAFSKAALDSGAAASTVNVAYENMGTAPSIYPIPANGGFQPFPGVCDSTSTATPFNFVCWFEVIPAQTPSSASYDNSNGGTGWMVGALDFIGFGDNRIAAFDWTGLCALDTSCGNSLQFGGTLYTTPQIQYMDEGFGCLAQFSGFCGLSPQKSGPIPLGDFCGAAGLSFSNSCPEGGIATNGDSATQASYADGNLWTAINTLVVQNFGTSSELHMGAVFWAIGSGSVTTGGTVSATHEDISMPAIAATDDGNALMSFTLSGTDFFPSSAYTWLTGTTGGTTSIHVTALGKSPQDGFSEYQGFPGLLRPRWGDYGAAVFVPSNGAGKGNVVFATEYIQSPNCSDGAFLNGITPNGNTCGGTRGVFANWGTSVNSIPGI